MILAAAKRLGITVEFKIVPWKRALHMVKHGTADAISYISKNPKRETFAIFDEKNILSYGSYVFFTLNEHTSSIQFDGQLKQLKPYRIGTVMGYNYSTKLNKADYLTIDNQSKNETTLLKRLLNKHFHIGLADQEHMALLARESGVSKHITYLSPALSHIPHYIAFSRAKDHFALAEKFGQAMHEFKQTAGYKNLLAKYVIQGEHY
jgi:polar amino acid transport system substrate-binding protein